MRIHLSSDEVNLLIHRYLLENGFLHSAFSFSTEASIPKNPFHVAHAEKLPPNALVTLLQKALLFIYIEYHTEDETGKAIPCEETFSFFKRHECWYRRREGSGDEAAAAAAASSSSYAGGLSSSSNLSFSPPSSSSSGVSFSTQLINIHSSSSDQHPPSQSLPLGRTGGSSHLPSHSTTSSSSSNSDDHLWHQSAATPTTATTAGGGGNRGGLQHQHSQLGPSGEVREDLASSSIPDESSHAGGIGSTSHMIRGGTKRMLVAGGGGGPGGYHHHPSSSSRGGGGSGSHKGKKRVRLNYRSGGAGTGTGDPSASSSAGPTDPSGSSSSSGGGGPSHPNSHLPHTTLSSSSSSGTSRSTENSYSHNSTEPTSQPSSSPSSIGIGGFRGGGNASAEEEEEGDKGTEREQPQGQQEGEMPSGEGVYSPLMSRPGEEEFEEEILVIPRRHLPSGTNQMATGDVGSGEEKVRLKNYLRLIAIPQEVTEAGALSEWSPVDTQLLITNFAAGSPWLYRLPSQRVDGPGVLSPVRELAGPRTQDGVNPGSSAHWKNDGELLATGYESGHVCIWNPYEAASPHDTQSRSHGSKHTASPTSSTSFLACLSVSRTSVICMSFSLGGRYLAAAAADGTVVIWEIRKRRSPLRRGKEGEEVGERDGEDLSSDGGRKRENTDKDDRRHDSDTSAIRSPSGEEGVHKRTAKKDEGTLSSFSSSSSASCFRSSSTLPGGAAAEAVGGKGGAGGGGGEEKKKCGVQANQIDKDRKVQSSYVFDFDKIHAYKHRGGVIDVDWCGDSLLASGSIDGCIVITDFTNQVVYTLPLGSSSLPFSAFSSSLSLSFSSSSSSSSSLPPVKREEDKLSSSSRGASGEKGSEDASSLPLFPSADVLASLRRATSPTLGNSHRAQHNGGRSHHDKDQQAQREGEGGGGDEEEEEQQQHQEAKEREKARCQSHNGTTSSSSFSSSASSGDAGSSPSSSAPCEAEVASLRWNKEGQYLAIVDSSSVVKLWRRDDPQGRLIELSVHLEPVIKAEWRDGGPDDDECFLITVAMDRQLLMWDVMKSTREPVKSLVYSYPPTSMRISGDGSRLAVATYDSAIHIYALPRLVEVTSLLDSGMVIPHISWQSGNESLAYNVFNMGRTIVANIEDLLLPCTRKPTSTSHDEQPVSSTSSSSSPSLPGGGGSRSGTTSSSGNRAE